MPRMHRFESPGALVHVMTRGLNGMDIFREELDRIEFFVRLERCLRKVDYPCHAWCLMDNHYHLLLRTNEVPISSLMRPLNGGYARWFNTKYRRRGYVFQDRYRSILCQEIDYAMELVRYIHLNPIRAGYYGTLRQLERFRWSGHRQLLGLLTNEGTSIIDRPKTLRWFGRNEGEAVKAYRKHLVDGLNLNDPSESGCMDHATMREINGASKGWPAVVGDPEFARKAMEKHKINRLRLHRVSDYNSVLEGLKNDVSKSFVLDPNELFRKGRRNQRSAARAAFCFRANKKELIPATAIANFLRISIPAVSLLTKRGEDVSLS